MTSKSATGLDEFTRRRLLRWLADYRTRAGQAPSFGDLEAGGFSRELVKEALRAGVLEEFYVTLTSGAVVKVFKAKG